MPSIMNPDRFLANSTVDAAVFELRPDYRALLVVVDGLTPAITVQGGGQRVEELIGAAEDHAAELLATSDVEALPHVAAWRDAYKAFGAKPQRTRNSLEALTRRAEKGLPRVNALTDVYNAISVLHQIPFGGEDFHRYQGAAHLTRATGSERFDTTANGEPFTEHPDAGEVVWGDEAGVTCRRWNWRQGRRTELTDDTRTGFFILDALAPASDRELHAAADALIDALTDLGSGVQATSRLVGAS
ncbi:DNA/RNA-binding domain of Phe-tRNA-synthetase-like protein [Mycolicibacterium mucogenicum 261Sha1.1M5]|nr:DNA/RNA-binding domain of Phe-tRNA-synthetase-like protein [Mycolicibacterium mucogenicum 261Sha1.1M5]